MKSQFTAIHNLVAAHIVQVNRWGAKEGYLVYPDAATTVLTGKFHQSHHQCSILGVSILSGTSLHPHLGDLIWEAVGALSQSSSHSH